MSGSVTVRRIGISSAPGSNRSTINDQISCTDQATTKSKKHTDQKKAFKAWSTSHMPTFAWLRSTWDAQPFLLLLGEATSQCQFRPRMEPCTHLLRRASPKCSQQCNEQQAFFAVASGRSSWTFWQRRGASMRSQTDGKTAQRQKMQACDQGECIDVKGLGLCTLL